ncbi:hypothetical protein E1161_12400 [Saccharopolyspora aridisoli]|uniref:Uncharacterized protein n=1 Tax=Saccharopolyspora aridisoli TaxID=2530385 RepID=A0A4R4UM43_9PSEU|nr:hypothetical protein [Saccharopolyspora aridisoli]TDC92881.1 hypothetical protein E1161_12400 [Saccharopolyspora aridisoli]
MEHARERTAFDQTVTVAELIRRGPQTPEQAGLADELADSEAAPTRSQQGGLGVLTTLGLLLLISAAGAAALIMAKPAQLPRPSHSAAAISGVPALRPDLVLEAAWPFVGNGGFAAAAEGGGNASAAEPEDTHLANPAAGSASTALRLVRDFYGRAQDSPDRIGELLAPELGQATELTRAWSAVDAVRLNELRMEPDGSVHAQVEAVYPGGRRVLLDHHLHVSPGPLPRIVSAELRSARQLQPG